MASRGSRGTPERGPAGRGTAGRGTAERDQTPVDTGLIELIQGALRASPVHRLTISDIVTYIVATEPTRDDAGLKGRVNKTLKASEGTYFRRPDGHPNMWEEQDFEGLRVLYTQLLQGIRRLGVVNQREDGLVGPMGGLNLNEAVAESGSE